MSRVRLPAVAGSFYPATSDACSAAVEHHLAEANPPDGPPPAALVAPHAGYVYSGPVAASAYARLARAGAPDRVLLLGPAHTVASDSMSITTADVWRTPLGDVAVDDEMRRACLECTGVVEDDRPHTREHSLELHLPFLQTVLGEFRFVPVVVGRVEAGHVANLIDHVWSDDVLVVVSTDLSHYHDQATAQRIDRRTAGAIVRARGEAIDGEHACGFYPLRGLLRVVAARGLLVEQLDLRTSGDTAGSADRVVGYGAFAVVGPTAA